MEYVINIFQFLDKKPEQKVPINVYNSATRQWRPCYYNSEENCWVFGQYRSEQIFDTDLWTQLPIL